MKLASTEDVRAELFKANERNAELEKRLNVDTKQYLEQERHEKTLVENEVVRLNEKISNLEYEIKRVKSIRLGDDWAQSEDEYLKINMKVKKLEDDIRKYI